MVVYRNAWWSISNHVDSSSLSYMRNPLGRPCKQNGSCNCSGREAVFFLGFIRSPLPTINHNDVLYSDSLVKSARYKYIWLSMDFNPFCNKDFKIQNFLIPLVSSFPFSQKLAFQAIRWLRTLRKTDLSGIKASLVYTVSSGPPRL